MFPWQPAKTLVYTHYAHGYRNTSVNISHDAQLHIRYQAMKLGELTTVRENPSLLTQVHNKQLLVPE